MPVRRKKAQTHREWFCADSRLLDVQTGSFEEFHLTDGVLGDSKAEKAFQPLPAGSLRLVDLGYFSLDAFEKLTALNVFWITRLKVFGHPKPLFAKPLKP